MSWTHGIGLFQAFIQKHWIDETAGGKPFIGMRLEFETSDVMAKIWLTEKAMPLARAQLKACGFDPDTQDLQTLGDNQTLLAGRMVQIDVVDDDKYGPQASIVTRKNLNATRLSELGKGLRDAKRDNEAPVAEASQDDGSIPF